MKKPGKRKPMFTDRQIITALEKSGGIHAGAARILGCSRQLIGMRINNSAEIQKALHDIVETRLDEAESALIRRVNDEDNVAQQVAAATFMLKHKGGARGYGGTRQTRIDLGPLESIAEVMRANAAVIHACTNGEIAPTEAKALSEMLNQRMNMLAVIENSQRFTAIEARLGIAAGRYLP